jgi:hypothetical protein
MRQSPKFQPTSYQKVVAADGELETEEQLTSMVAVNFVVPARP